MTLTDPRDALADQSSFIGYLMGLARLGRVVRSLTDDNRAAQKSVDADNFIYALLGVARLGEAVQTLADTAPFSTPTRQTPTLATEARWLR